MAQRLGLVNSINGTYHVNMSSIDRETEKLREWLRSKESNIKEIAERTGIGRTTLYRFLDRDGNLTLTRLSALSKERERRQDNGDKAA